MGPNMLFNLSISVSKERKPPFLQRYDTYGGYKVFQFGFLGLYVQLNYGMEK